jgi:hypothetical protein
MPTFWGTVAEAGASRVQAGNRKLVVGTRAGWTHLLFALVLLSVCAIPVVAPPRVPSVGEWAGIRAMKFLKCRYYRYDRSGRDVCEGDSIEDLRMHAANPPSSLPPRPFRWQCGMLHSGRTGGLVWLDMGLVVHGCFERASASHGERGKLRRRSHTFSLVVGQGKQLVTCPTHSRGFREGWPRLVVFLR